MRDLVVCSERCADQDIVLQTCRQHGEQLSRKLLHSVRSIFCEDETQTEPSLTRAHCAGTCSACVREPAVDEESEDMSLPI